MARLTKKNRQKLLEQNEGFSTRSYYSSRNSREEREYTIKGSKLLIRATGKTSWADSHYDKSWEASDEQTHRFLRKYLDKLNTKGLD